MLVLSRHVDESLFIGDNVVITILEVRGKQVRVGIEAPPDVEILREELCEHGLLEEEDTRAGLA